MAENIIYCYSGSGHCLSMAKSIAQKLGDTDIVMMRSFPAVTDARGAKRVGFVFSCMAGGLPGDMEKYLDGKGIRYESFHTDGGHNMVNGRKFMGITIARFFK